MTHASVWAAIDKIADGLGISVSELAIRAGLDSTCFNPSKRVGRWPSTKSISRVIAVAGLDFTGFGMLVDATLFRGAPKKPLVICETVRETAIANRSMASAAEIGRALGVSRNVIIGHWNRARANGECSSRLKSKRKFAHLYQGGQNS